MDITHNLEIKASKETVYNAVVTKDGIQGWWAKEGTVGETEGASSLLRFNKQGQIVEMEFETKTLIPNQKVVWECTGNGNPAWIGTQIITEIKEGNEGVNVIFSHAGFDEKWSGTEPFEMTKGGWNHFVDSLVSFCEKGEGKPW